MSHFFNTINHKGQIMNKRIILTAAVMIAHHGMSYGMQCEQTPNFRTSLERAKNGNAWEQRCVGRTYRDGKEGFFGSSIKQIHSYDDRPAKDEALAMEWLTRAINQKSDLSAKIAAHLDLAGLHKRNKNAPKALEHIQQAIDDSKNISKGFMYKETALYKRAKIYFKDGNFEKAKEDLDTLNNPSFRVTLGWPAHNKAESMLKKIEGKLAEQQ